MDQELLLAISDLMDKKMKPIDQNLESMDQRLGNMEQKLEKIEVRQDQMDYRLDQMDHRLDGIELEQKRLMVMMEHNVIPRLQNLEGCYTTTYKRYANGIGQLDKLQADMDIVKEVVLKHSNRLQQLA